MPELEKHDFSFNILDKKRPLTANHQKYLIENVRESIYEPKTRERLRFRELVGYWGHGIRQFAKMKPSETSIVQTKAGPLKVECEPSNVTTALECSKDGIFSHSQEICENGPGKKVSGMIRSKVGGFSWAFDPGKVPQFGITPVGRFYGMDYVLDPGFTENRAFILENAEPEEVALVLESVSKNLNVKEIEAEQILRDWQLTATLKNAELQGIIEDAKIFEAAQREQLEELSESNVKLKEKIKCYEDLTRKRSEIVAECAERSTIVIPDEVLLALTNLDSKEDFRKIMGVFEKASQINMNNYPVAEGNYKKVKVPVSPLEEDDDDSGVLFTEEEDINFYELQGLR